jgi:DnaK suppressor protein
MAAEERMHPELDGEAQQELWRRLMDERHRLRELYRHDVEAGQESAEQGTDDSIDRAAASYDRELAFALSDAERERVRLIDEALERLEAGTYGFCLRSGEAIPLERLREVPWARYRADVQEDVEQGLVFDGRATARI